MGSGYSARVEHLLAATRQPEMCGMAVMELIELNTSEANDVLVQLVQDLSLGQFYIYAVMALSQRKCINAVPYIRCLFDAPDEHLYTDNHLAGIVLLQDYPDHPDTMLLLSSALQRYHGQEFWQFCTLQTLAHIGSDEAIYLVAQALAQHDNVQVRVTAAQELGTTPNPLAAHVLLRYLEQEHPLSDDPVISAVLHALGKHWQKNYQPCDSQHLVQVLTRWLYANHTEAQEQLQMLQTPEAQAAIETWEQWQLVYRS